MENTLEQSTREKLVVEYSMTYDQLKVVGRRSYIIFVLFWLFNTIILAGLFLFEFFFGDQKFNLFSSITLVFLVFWLLAFTSAYIRIGKIQWKKVESVPKERRVTIELEGVMMETHYSHIKCPWFWIASAYETKQLYVLNTIMQTAIVIPKGELHDNDELFLREIVQRNVFPNKIRFKKKKIQ